jgi:adenine/guanine phosphoribosyltransferase-like PRPP-binding protein
MNNHLVSPHRFDELVDRVVSFIRNDDTFHPNAVLALSTGGFPVAAAIAKRLHITSRHVVGMPAYRDDNGDYHLDDQILKLQGCKGLTFIVVDDASNRGILTRKAVESVEQQGGVARSCVLVAREGALLPDYVAETCTDKPPKFFWEQSAPIET